MKNLRDNAKRIMFAGVAVALILAVLMIINHLLDKKLQVNPGEMDEGTIYKYHIAMIGSNPSDSFWTSIYEGAREEGIEKDVYVENFGENLTEDYSVEERMKMAIAAKVDGIVVEADNSETIRPLIDEAEAAEKKIPVMTILSDVPNSGRVSFVSGNDYAMGEIYGGQILEDVEQRTKNGKEEKVRVTVLIDSREENSPPNLIYSGIKEAVSSMSDKIELSTVLIDSSGEFESEETIRSLVLDKAYPEILVSLSAVDTIGAYQSVVDYNMVGKITVIGYHSSRDILEMIRKGVIKSTISINAEEMGKTVTDGMCEFLASEYVSEYLPVDTELIDDQNVEEYLKDEDE